MGVIFRNISLAALLASGVRMWGGKDMNSEDG